MSPEVWLFFQACLLGAALGMLYDVFRILRLAFPNGNVLIFVEDVLYFVFVTIASFSFVMLCSGGVLRIFMLFGELLGAILYFFTLSIIILKAAQWIIRLVKRFFRFLYRLFIRPFARLFRWLFLKLKKRLRRCRAGIKNFAAQRKKDLKHKKGLVYNGTVFDVTQGRSVALEGVSAAAEWDIGKNGQTKQKKGRKSRKKQQK